MEKQPNIYVNTFSFTIDASKDTTKEFNKYILTFDVDLNPANDDEEYEIFHQTILSPSVEILGKTSIMLQFITRDVPLDREWFSLFPIHYDCITTMLMDYESKEDAGMYMWFGDKPIFKKVNKAYFILKKIDALRLTEAPESVEELAAMVEEPPRVIAYIIKESGVPLEKLPYNNFRPKIRSNEFFET